VSCQEGVAEVEIDGYEKVLEFDLRDLPDVVQAFHIEYFANYIVVSPSQCTDKFAIHMRFHSSGERVLYVRAWAEGVLMGLHLRPVASAEDES